MSEYELGNIPELDNIQFQMALIQLTEEKFIGKSITENEIYEMTKNGRFLRNFNC